MATTLPLDKMSLEDKLQAMELLWDDLCKKAEGIASPDWHEEVLADRETMLKAGVDDFEDWDVAKGKIRNQTS